MAKTPIPWYARKAKDKFEWRLDQAQPLPDFFFNKLQADIDIKSLDGKAHLSNLAMPMINEIPSGVFKQLMIEQLSILTGLAADKLVARLGVRGCPVCAIGPQVQADDE